MFLLLGPEITLVKVAAFMPHPEIPVTTLNPRVLALCPKELPQRMEMQFMYSAVAQAITILFLSHVLLELHVPVDLFAA